MSQPDVTVHFHGAQPTLERSRSWPRPPKALATDEARLDGMNRRGRVCLRKLSMVSGIHSHLFYLHGGCLHTKRGVTGAVSPIDRDAMDMGTVTRDLPFRSRYVFAPRLDRYRKYIVLLC